MAGFTPAPYTAEADETVKCPACGKMNDTDAHFCDQCGAPLPGDAPYSPSADETVKCPQCGKMNAPDARFCDQCGVKLQGSDAVDSSRSEFKPPFSDGGPVSRSIVPGPGFVEPQETGKMPHLVGNFAPYDEWAEINSSVEGHFMERHSRSAWSKSLRDNRANLRVLFHHGEDNMTGVMPLGTIEHLEPGARAVHYDVDLFDVDYVHRLLPALKAGQLGTSWTFHPVKDKFTVDPRPQRSAWNPGGIPEVTHHEIRLVEFGPCMFPAYAGAAAGVRSMTDYYLFSRLAKNPDQLQQLLTTVPKPVIVPAEEALSNERAEGEPHSGAESRKVPLVPVRKRFQNDQQWHEWLASVKAH